MDAAYQRFGPDTIGMNIIHCMYCQEDFSLDEVPVVVPASTLICQWDGGLQILSEVLAELERADAKYAHDPMSSAELGLATIRCEFVELEREVVRGVRHEDWMRKEAVQVAAMAIKFLRDVCGRNDAIPK
jgi:hypothetical protein